MESHFHRANVVPFAAREPTRGFGRPFLATAFERGVACREPWGDARVTLAFAGRRFCFTGLATEQALWLHERYRPLLAGDERSTVEPAAVRVWRAPGGSFVPYARHRSPASLTLGYDRASVRLAGLFLYGYLLRGAALGAATLRGAMWLPAADRRCFEWGFENFLRVLLAYQAAADGGVLLHSAAIRRRGGVSLFFGHSGDGKTTLAERFAAMGFDVIGDDLNVLTPDSAGGGYLVRQLPYAGAFGRAGLRLDAHPLRATLRLRQGRRVARRRLGPAEAVGNLLACAPFVNGDHCWREPLIDGLSRLAAATPPELIALSLRDDPARVLGVAAS